MTRAAAGRSSPRWRPARLAADAALAGLVVAILVTLSLSFDSRLAREAETLPPDAVAWGHLLSTIGTTEYQLALCALVAIGSLVMRPARRRGTHAPPLPPLTQGAVCVFVTVAVSWLAAQVVKHLVGRARPRYFEVFGPYHFDVLSMKSALASFPSGHATTAFAMAMAISLMLPRFRVALFTLAAAIAASRIIVQAHYLSDIAAGAALGVVMALAVARGFGRFGIAVRDEAHRPAGHRDRGGARPGGS